MPEKRAPACSSIGRNYLYLLNRRFGIFARHGAGRGRHGNHLSRSPHGSRPLRGRRKNRPPRSSRSRSRSALRIIADGPSSCSSTRTLTGRHCMFFRRRAPGASDPGDRRRRRLDVQEHEVCLAVLVHAVGEETYGPSVWFGHSCPPVRRCRSSGWSVLRPAGCSHPGAREKHAPRWMSFSWCWRSPAPSPSRPSERTRK